MIANTDTLSTTRKYNYQIRTITKVTVHMDQLYLQITAMINCYCLLILYAAYVVYHGHCKPLIGQHDTETTAGQTQQLLIVLSAMDVMWFL